MKIIVDNIPEYPVDCLFSVQNTNSKIGTYFTCSLKENIDGKHKNSPCICKNTRDCGCLKKIFSQEDNDVCEPVYVNDKGELIGLDNFVGGSVI